MHGQINFYVKLHRYPSMHWADEATDKGLTRSVTPACLVFGALKAEAHTLDFG